MAALMERARPDVPVPRGEVLATDVLWANPKKPNLPALQEHFLLEGRLADEDVVQIMNKAAALFREEPNLHSLKAPITVCGDIHGQFYDLCKLLQLGGDPAKTNYLFLGDYVDRGCFSVEVSLFLFALKINYPKSFYLLRGNHECRQMTEFFNFRDECEYKYSFEVWELFMSTFDTLPLAATVDQKFLCMHGGISPEISSLDDIRKIKRFCEPPTSGAMCDVLWSDPVEDPDEYVRVDWEPNSVRGCSYLYGFKAVEPFLLRNKLYSIVRAHEAQLEGYKFHEYCQSTEFPSVVTIFSAPNYCDAYNNKGAILKFHDRVFNICQFKCSPHPYHLPNFLDVFSWSMPFVCEKVTEILYELMAGEDDEEEEDTRPQDRDSVIRNKVQSVSRFLNYYKLLREENEQVVRLKGLVGKLPVGLLSQGRGAITQALQDYDQAKELDRINEKRPAPRD